VRARQPKRSTAHSGRNDLKNGKMPKTAKNGETAEKSFFVTIGVFVVNFVIFGLVLINFWPCFDDFLTNSDFLVISFGVTCPLIIMMDSFQHGFEVAYWFYN
jgi:hypothetical protein